VVAGCGKDQRRQCQRIEDQQHRPEKSGVTHRSVTSPGALIGHQESWRSVSDVLAVLRGAEHTRLPDDEIMEIFPWILPRAICDVEVASAICAKARGVYIDCFIPPAADHSLE
jgi:hypothetical protein